MLLNNNDAHTRTCKESEVKLGSNKMTFEDQPYYYFDEDKLPRGNRTSRTEITHLLMGVLLFSLVEFSILVPMYGIQNILDFSFIFTLFLITLILVTPAFIAHEMAHKLVAQKYGFWAEFRVFTQGALLTLVTLFTPFKLIAPGAVMIYGHITREKNGKISLAGPMTNLILISIFLLLILPFNSFNELLGIVGILGAKFNADIALFNLLPIFVLDGKKILDWNKKAWISAIGLTVALWASLTFFLFTSGPIDIFFGIILGMISFFGFIFIYLLFWRERKITIEPIFPSPITTLEKQEHVEPPKGAKKPTKASGVCYMCNNPVFMPFVCSYCGETFCAEHRLPESHNCQFFRRV